MTEEETIHIVCSHCTQINRIPKNRLKEGPKCGSCHQPFFVGHPIILTEKNFESCVKYSDIPIVVDFWAEWCGPCRAMAPVFEKACQSFEPAVRFAKVNSDEEQILAGRYAIRGIPTLILFHQGKEVDRVSGAMDASRLTAWLKQKLAL